MPTYEYTCRDCGHTFDVVQKMTDEPLTICPECGGELRKVFAVPAIAFRGSGFYATDHGKKSKRPSEASDKGAGDKAASGSDTGKKDTPSTGGREASGTEKGATTSTTSTEKEGKGS